jgi:hypothetical protein
VLIAGVTQSDAGRRTDDPAAGAAHDAAAQRASQTGVRAALDGARRADTTASDAAWAARRPRRSLRCSLLPLRPQPPPPLTEIIQRFFFNNLKKLGSNFIGDRLVIRSN